ncbi:MAG: DUF2085 domain-containing protein [Thermoplasmatota archaeon]
MSRLREFICHGEKDRCFTFFGHKLPICSRCTGFYSGIVVGLLLHSLFFDLDVMFLFIFSIISLIPMSIDGLIQEFTDYESNNTIRLTTGLICGLFIGMDLSWILFYLLV